MITLSISAALAFACFSFMRLTFGREERSRTLVILFSLIGLVGYTWVAQAEITAVIPKYLTILQCGLGSGIGLMIGDRIFYSHHQRS